MSNYFFKSEPIGSITLDSPLPPQVVLANLRERGREWRESAVPEKLKGIRVTNLDVAIKGSEFEMLWVGQISPFHNPVMFGIVQPYGTGSRIRAGFRRNTKVLRLIGLIVAVGMLSFFARPGFVHGLFSGFIGVLLAVELFTHRRAEPARAQLIEALRNATTKPELPRPAPASVLH